MTYNTASVSTIARPHLVSIKQEKSVTQPQTRYVKPLHKHQMSTSAKSPFKRWPMAMIESHGNYRDDAAIIEPLVGGPLYSAQKDLPKLPIPNDDLKDLIQTFLPTALPLAESPEEARNLIENCKSFPEQAAELQNRLIHRRNVEMKDTSWLQLWWNTEGYLKIRDPVTVNVSYFFHLADDDSIAANFNAAQDSASKPKLNVQRGAALLHATAEFRKMICSGSYPHEKMGRKGNETPLCSVAFKYMFNSCRIPKREMDTYKMYDPSLNKHVVVARKGRFYSFDFVNEEGEPIAVADLEKCLEKCIQLADEAEANGDEKLDLGWCTSSDRDSWADAREEMLRVGGKTAKKALEKLESGAILLCLDDEEAYSKQQCADLFWTGDLKSGLNRWFDKSIQLFCTENGKAGLQGEHSMMDGMPVISFTDYITTKTYGDAKSKNGNPSQTPIEVEDIFSDTYPILMSSNSNMSSFVAKAHGDFNTLITDQEQTVQYFLGYGSKFMKKAGYSPDAYAQMAIQLAVYRLHGKQVGTYEATQMRPFLHGRTETTRTVSKESAAFCKRMGMMANFKEDPKELEEKRKLLQEAVKTHVNYIKKAGKGNGVDRHFLGLAMLSDNSVKLPDLYADPVFARSKTWRVSTSHLTHPNIDNWGFGEVVPDGLGVAYGVKPDTCFFNISARREHGWTEKFNHLLQEALLEMGAIHEPVFPSKL